MIETAVQFAKDTATFNSIFGITLYWLPLFICSVGFTIRTFRNVQADKYARRVVEDLGEGYYRPTDTIGDVIGRALVTFIPIANLWIALFDLGSKSLSSFFSWIGKTFDQPLVPERKTEVK